MSKTRVRAFTLIELMIVMAIIAILAAILVPNFMRTRAQSQIAGCKENLKNVATALEMYANDNTSNFPFFVGFVLITPNYLPRIPSCPSAGVDTYSPGYIVNGVQSAYTVVCVGSNHLGGGMTAANYPQYSSFSGLVNQ